MNGKDLIKLIQDAKVVDFNTKNGSILKIINAHVDSSTEEFYPY